MKKGFLQHVSFLLALVMTLGMFGIMASADTTSDETDISEAGIYSYTFVSALPDLTNANVMLDAYNNDAVDSWDLAVTSASADGTAYCLKPTFSPPRTHLTFAFEAPADGTYSIAVEYRSAANNSLCRRMGFQVDDLGIEQITPQTAELGVSLYMIVSIKLDEGSHTFTLYAPDNFDEKTESGQSIASLDLHSYKVWTGDKLPFYAASCETALPDLTDMNVVAELGNKDAVEIWEGGDKTDWSDTERVTLDTTKTHMTFGFTAPQKAIYYVAVQYGKTTLDAGKELYVGFQMDAFAIDQVVLTQSAETDMWMIVSIELSEGEHTFTVRVPENLGSEDSDGKTITSAELLAYQVWTKNVVPPYDYQYTFAAELTDMVPSVIAMDCGVNGATDSWDLEYTQGCADGTGLMLKPDFTPPRTHLGFSFDVEKAGEYKIAITYDAPANASLDRSVDVQIDSLGRTRISAQPTDTKQYLVITQYLEAGSHTLTVYAPESFGAKNDAGQTIHSCTMYSFLVYLPISAESLMDMVDGAAVKIASTSALRYTTRVDKSLYDSLVELYGEENVSVGTLFGSAADVAALGTLTKEAFNKEALTYYDSPDGELLEDENGYYFYGYWEEDDTSRYGEMMAAVGYVRIKIEGRSNYLYVTHDADNDRSIAMVAERALADTKTASEQGYENSVTANGSAVYSPYTSKQYECLVELAAWGKEE